MVNASDISGWEVPPNPLTGEGGYSTRDPSAAFKPGAVPVHYGGGGKSQAQLNAETRARGVKEREYARQAEIQAQKQAEINRQNQANSRQQQQAQQAQQQQTIVTSRSPTLSTGGTPIRNVQLGKDVAEYQRRSFVEAKEKKRNLYLSEKDVIATKVVQPKINTTPTISTATEIIPGITGESNIPQSRISKITGKAINYYNIAEEKVSSKTTKPIFNFIQSRTGLDITTPGTQNLLSQSSLGIGSYGLKPSVESDFVSGGTSAVLKDIKEKPVKNVLIYGAGTGIGFGVGAVTAGLTKLSPMIGGITKGSLMIGGVVAGGTYAYGVGKQIYGSKNLSEAGAVTGLSTKNLFLFGGGYKTGEKGFEVARGLYSTRGRTFIDIPQGIYPQANPKQQLNLFRKNVYSKLGDKPGAFHTTSETFWNGGKITPNVGGSELPGLYGSTKISTSFSRIQGSGSTIQKFNIKNWFRDIFHSSSKPGVAYIQPESYRYSPAKPGKWYLKAKAGVADVPGIKSEIEAIFRPGTGNYILTGTGYYTKIKGVRVPIDSFSYSGGSVSPNVITLASSGGYSGSPSYSGITPTPNILIPYSNNSPSVVTTSTTSNVPVSKSYSYVPSSSSLKYYSSPSSVSKSSKISSTSSSSSNKLISVTPRYSSSKSSSKSYSSIIPSSSYFSSSSRRSYKPPKMPGVYQGKGFKQPKKTSGTFKVFGRRFGKFRIVGISRTERGAFKLGKTFASKSLGATFKVPKSKVTKITGFRTKITKKGTLFIEPRKRRLKKGGKEVQEIQIFKQAKKKKKKGGKKK